MILGLFQTVRSLINFWRTAANLDGAHAELERNLMRDKWGPPDAGWPNFDEEGKRLLERALGEPENEEHAKAGAREIKRLLNPGPEDLYAEIGGEA